MLIKIDNERYINSDHIRTITLDPTEPDTFCICFGPSLVITTTQVVIDYIVEVLDANTSIVFEQPAEQSLESRLAAHLRNQTTGQLFEELEISFPAAHSNEIVIALHTLLHNHVIVTAGMTLGINPEEKTRYYHASNVTPSDDSEPDW